MTKIDGSTDNLRRRAMVTGGAGLLGRFMAAQLESTGWKVFAFDHASLDVGSQEDISRGFAQSNPALVINCAATTDVDRCELDADWAYRINATGPRLLARYCAESGADLVHLSTDYVFDGTKGALYTQEDEPNPLSTYAKSKLAGELEVREENPQAYLVRTSWIFGPGGKNFGSRVLEWAAQGLHIRAATDQTSIPTYAPDLAARIEEIVRKGHPGLYHITNSGETSWYDFAQYALRLADYDQVALEPVKRRDLRQLAPRPMNTPMRCLLSEKLGLRPLRHWRQALDEFVRLRQREQ